MSRIILLGLCWQNRWGMGWCVSHSHEWSSWRRWRWAGWISMSRIIFWSYSDFLILPFTVLLDDRREHVFSWPAGLPVQSTGTGRSQMCNSWFVFLFHLTRNFGSWGQVVLTGNNVSCRGVSFLSNSCRSVIEKGMILHYKTRILNNVIFILVISRGCGGRRPVTVVEWSVFIISVL